MGLNTPAALIARTLQRVVELLVRQDYAALERLSSGVRLTAAEIESGIIDYGRSLVMPPPEAFRNADIIPVRGSRPQAYSVRLRLYTQEEGASDLELQATLVEDQGTDLLKVEIDNILVA